MNSILTAKDYVDIAIGKIKSDVIALTKKETIKDTDTYSEYIYHFSDNAIINRTIQDVNGNCWDIGETRYTETFIQKPENTSQ